MSGTNTRSSVLDWVAMENQYPSFEIRQGYSLRDGELSKVVTNHLGLDLNSVELLSRVDTNNGANHLGDDNHVTEVGLDGIRLLVGLSLLLGLAQLLDETHGLALQTAVEASAGAGVDDIAELVRREIEESGARNTRVSYDEIPFVYSTCRCG